MPFARFFIAVLFLYGIFATNEDGFATNLKKELGETYQTVADKKKIIQELTLRERALHKDLAEIEIELGKLEKDLAEQEKQAVAMEKQKEFVQQTYKFVLEKMEQKKKSLSQVICQLWPMYLEQSVWRVGSNWAESDRKFTWMQHLYRHGEQRFSELADQSKAVSKILKDVQDLQAQIEEQERSIAAAKQKLQSRKIDFAGRVSQVRLQKLSHQEELDRLVQIVESLRHKIKAENLGKISKLKGELPMPVQGTVKLKYNLQKNPPQKGIGFAVGSQDEVRAVATGQVVHNDKLRGFGQVVIVVHEKNYYSLYAFLAESEVKNGEKVKQGDVLGKCGFFPEVDGYGLYFELRFQQKTINPLLWFAQK